MDLEWAFGKWLTLQFSPVFCRLLTSDSIGNIFGFLRTGDMMNYPIRGWESTFFFWKMGSHSAEIMNSWSVVSVQVLCRSQYWRLPWNFPLQPRTWIWTLADKCEILGKSASLAKNGTSSKLSTSAINLEVIYLCTWYPGNTRIFYGLECQWVKDLSWLNVVV